MTKSTHNLTLSACALAATLFLAACGGGASTDTVTPTVAITSAAGTGGAVVFSFVFSEDVGSSFTADDVAVTGGTKASTVTKVDATHYTLSVTPDVAASAIAVTVATSKFNDAANNTNAVAADNSFGLVPTTAPTTPPTRVASDVVSIYGEAYTVLTGVNMRPDWGQSTTATEQTVAGNKIEQYAALNYEGIEFPQVDVSAMTKLHIDVWTPNLATFKLFVISAGQESAVTLTPTLYGWNSYDLDLSSFTAADKTKVIQLKLDAQPASGTLYLDNIYFYKAASAPVSCGTTVPTCAPTTTIPAGAVTIYSEAATVTGFNARPDWGQSVTESEVTIASNKSLKYTFQGGGFGSVGSYEGLDWAANPVDVSAKGKMHLDLWSTDMSSLKISLISAGKESAYTQAITTSGWNSVDIDLSNYTAANKAAIIQLKIESATAGTVYIDNIYFWGTPSAGGGSGSGGTFAGGIYSSDYTGSLSDASAKSTLGGTVGFFYDQRLFDTKVYQDGSVSGSAADPAGVHNFWYGFGKSATPVYTDAYFGGFVNAPGNTTADATAFAKVQLKFWGDAETWEKTFTPQAEVILQGPTNSACTNGSGRPEISRTVSGQKIGAGSLYTIAKTDFTLTASCGGAYTINTVWSQVGSIAVKLSGTNLQYSITAPSTPPAYPTFLNIGPISFIN